MTIRIYIASSFDFTEDIKEIEKRLNQEFDNQVAITRDWWNNNVDLKIKHDDSTFEQFLANPYTRALCECDFLAIEQSDLVLLYNPKEGKKLTGAMIEAGYGLGKGKPLYLLGWFKKSAMYSRGVPVENLQQFINIIKFHIVGAYKTEDMVRL